MWVWSCKVEQTTAVKASLQFMPGTVAHDPPRSIDDICLEHIGRGASTYPCIQFMCSIALARAISTQNPTERGRMSRSQTMSSVFLSLHLGEMAIHVRGLRYETVRFSFKGRESMHLRGHQLTCLLRLIARHEQEIPNWKMKTKPRMIMY